MKKLIYVFTTICLISCSSSKDISSYNNYESECLGIELDGSQTIKAYGIGKNRSDALEQAKKNAVRDVIFKGIRRGSADCNMRPLVLEVNANERYSDYFNSFFKDGGKYLKFIEMKDKKNNSNIKNSNRFQTSYFTVVRVLREQLREELISSNIIKQ